jgi:hypothetical protein
MYICVFIVLENRGHSCGNFGGLGVVWDYAEVSGARAALFRGAHTQPAACATCPPPLQANSYQNATGQASCMLCPAGTSTNDTGNPQCNPCFPGSYAPSAGVHCLEPACFPSLPASPPCLPPLFVSVSPPPVACTCRVTSAAAHWWLIPSRLLLLLPLQRRRVSPRHRAPM